MKNNRLLWCVLVFSWAAYSFVGSRLEFNTSYTKLVVSPDRYDSVQPLLGNPPWLIAVMAPFVYLPLIGFAAFTLVSLISIWKSSEVLGGNKYVAILSAQAMLILFWGQVDTLAVGGVALAYYGMDKKNSIALVIGSMLATVKPQIGAAPLAVILLWSGWRAIPALIALGASTVISMSVLGPWPMWIIRNASAIASSSGGDPWKVSVGPHAPVLSALMAIVAVCVLTFPVERRKKLAAFVACVLLASPYLPFYSTIVLLAFPVHPLLWPFAFTGFFAGVVGSSAWKIIAILPAGIVLEAIYLYWRTFSGDIKENQKRVSVGHASGSLGSRGVSTQRVD